MTNILYGTSEDLLDIETIEKNQFGTDSSEDLSVYNSTFTKLTEEKLVNGIISKITDNDVYVSVGFKSEGIIGKDEFKDLEELKIGQEVEVSIEELEDIHGQIILSRQKAHLIRAWNKINEIHESGESITGKVLRRIKGGVIVNILGLETFLPGSQIDLKAIPNLDDLIDTEIEVRVIKINRIRKNIVISRRVILEQQRSVVRNGIINKLKVGQEHEGVIKNITDFGAFLDLGGVDGLLHITDMSWGRVNHPSELFSVGDTISVIILDFNEEKQRISLGRKQLNQDPWKELTNKYKEGAYIKGKVISLTDYGAFVEIEEGIEGLIHISEMSWTEHVKHPSQILKVGEETTAEILQIDLENQKISLGIKQTQSDPWDNLEDEIPVGSKITGVIKNLTAFGAFISIKEGVNGLIHISDISWTKKLVHSSEVFQKGQEVELVVMSIDKEKRRISLSKKHLVEDPWENIEKLYPIGKEISKAKVIRCIDRGLIVELEQEIEALIPVNQLTTEKITHPESMFKVGDEVPAVVTDINIFHHRLTLSVLDYFKNKADEEFAEYLKNNPVNQETFGDQLEDKL